MSESDAKFQQAIHDLALALPEGKFMQAVAFKTGDRVVHALVIADSADDLASAGDIIQRGAAMSSGLPPYLPPRFSGEPQPYKFDPDRPPIGFGPPPLVPSSDSTIATRLFAERLGKRVVTIDKGYSFDPSSKDE